MYNPYPTLLQAIDRLMTGEISGQTLFAAYGDDYFALSPTVSGENPKARAFHLAIQLIVLNDLVCDRQWHELADRMVYLQPIFYRDVEIHQLQIILLSFPTFAQHYRRQIPGSPAPLPSGICIWN